MRLARRHRALAQPLERQLLALGGAQLRLDRPLPVEGSRPACRAAALAALRALTRGASRSGVPGACGEALVRLPHLRSGHGRV